MRSAGVLQAEMITIQITWQDHKEPWNILVAVMGGLLTSLEHNTAIWTPYCTLLKELKLLSGLSGSLLNVCKDTETTRIQNGSVFFNCTV